MSVVHAKLAVLEELPPGWDGPGSLPADAGAVRAFREFLSTFDHPPADLEPLLTPAGAIRMEWDRSDCSFTAEIDPEGSLFLCRLAVVESEDSSVVLDCFSADALANFYRSGDIPCP